LRLAYVLVAPRLDPLLRADPLHGDAQGYHLLANNLLQGCGLSWDCYTPTSFRPPLYPVFLALIYAPTGSSVTFARIVQAIVGAFLVVPVFVIAHAFTRIRVAILAALIIAIHPLLVYTTGWLISETLVLTLFWVAMALLLHAWQNGRRLYAFASGLSLGLASLGRSELALFPLAALALALVLRLRKPLIRSILISITVALFTVLPWVVRNNAVHEGWVFLTTNAGVNLYGGNNSEADGGFRSDLPYVFPEMTEVESDHEFMTMALGWIMQHPGEFLSLWPRKAMSFASPLALGTSRLPGGKWMTMVNLGYVVVLLLSGWGLVEILRYRREAFGMLLLPLVYPLLLCMVFFGGIRFSLLSIPAVVIGGTKALYMILDAVTLRRRASTG